MATANKGVPPKVARATPRLKLQTHYEAKGTEMSVSKAKAMWAALYARNKWKPIP